MQSLSQLTCFLQGNSWSTFNILTSIECTIMDQYFIIISHSSDTKMCVQIKNINTLFAVLIICTQWPSKCPHLILIFHQLATGRYLSSHPPPLREQMQILSTSPLFLMSFTCYVRARAVCVHSHRTCMCKCYCSAGWVTHDSTLFSWKIPLILLLKWQNSL